MRVIGTHQREDTFRLDHRVQFALCFCYSCWLCVVRVAARTQDIHWLSLSLCLSLSHHHSLARCIAFAKCEARWKSEYVWKKKKPKWENKRRNTKRQLPIKIHIQIEIDSRPLISFVFLFLYLLLLLFSMRSYRSIQHTAMSNWIQCCVHIHVWYFIGFAVLNRHSQILIYLLTRSYERPSHIHILRKHKQRFFSLHWRYQWQNRRRRRRRRRQWSV